MITMVENEKSSGQQLDQSDGQEDKGFSSVDARFDKVEADMREGFARLDQSINGLRGEMNQLGESLRTETNTRFLALEGNIHSLQRTIVGATAATIAALIGVVGAIMAAAIGGIIALVVFL